jgi:hypothetical protein
MKFKMIVVSVRSEMGGTVARLNLIAPAVTDRPISPYPAGLELHFTDPKASIAYGDTFELELLPAK